VLRCVAGWLAGWLAVCARVLKIFDKTKFFISFFRYFGEFYLYP
jgi:hypothetical protein